MPNYRVVCAIYFWLEVLKDIILNSIPLALGATINYFRIEGSGITQKIDSLNAPPVYITLPTATRIVPKTITVVERIIGPTSYVENVYAAITKTDLLFPDDSTFPWRLFGLDEMHTMTKISLLLDVICFPCFFWTIYRFLMKKPLIPTSTPSHDINNDTIHEQNPPIPSQSDEPENPNSLTNVETQVEIVSRQMKVLSNRLAQVNRSLRFLKKKKTVKFFSVRSRRKTPSRESCTSPLNTSIDASAQSISVSSQRRQSLQAEDQAQELPIDTIEFIRNKRVNRIVKRLSQNQKRDEPSIEAVEKRKESVKDGELPLQGNKPDSLIYHQDQDQNPATTPVLDESPEESDSTSGMKRKKSLRITPPHTPEKQSGPVSDQEPITPIDQGESPMKKQKLNHQDEDQEISTEKQPSMTEKEREESDSQYSTSIESTSSTQDDQDQYPYTIPSLDEFFQQLVAKRGNSLAITSPSTPENMNPSTEYSAITPTVEEKYEQEKDNLLPQKSNADAESSSSAALLRPTRVQHLESWIQIINEHRPHNAETKIANILNGITTRTRDDGEKSGHSQGASVPEDHDKKSKSLFFLNMRKRYLALIGFLVLFLGSSFPLVVSEQGKVHQQFLLLDAGPEFKA